MVVEMAAAAAAGPALALVEMVEMAPLLLPGRMEYAPTPVVVVEAVAAALPAQAPMAIPAMLMAAAVPEVRPTVAVRAALAAPQLPAVR